MIGRAIQAPRPAAAAMTANHPNPVSGNILVCSVSMRTTPVPLCASNVASRVASRVEVGPMRAMSPVDHAWYRMDSPENLMMVHAIMWTDEPLDWDAVRSDVAEG